jgi:PBP1b-binding outer membrane lipoprotein LpoB
MKKFFILVMTALFVTACAHGEKRDPAAVEKDKKENTHRQFQGVFDKQY